MNPEEGLSCYEHEEADLRPDLFLQRPTDPLIGTSKRLNPNAYYIAVRFLLLYKRWELHNAVYRLKNPKSQKSVVASLVDWGPNEETGRVADVSPAIMRALQVETDDVLYIESLNI